MKIIKIFLFLFLFLNSCVFVKNAPSGEYARIPVKTGDYILLSRQKIKNPGAAVKIYIEGHGNAYDKYGNPSGNPTPRSRFVRNLALKDPSDNVVYLARPGQFIKISGKKRHEWSCERFSQKNIDNLTQALKEIAGGNEIILIGYSASALLTGIIINQNPDLKVKEWITIAGLFNHGEWTRHFNYLPLKNCKDLNSLPDIRQTHFIGKKDRVIPYTLSIKRLPEKSVVLVEKAGHNKGFEAIYGIIWDKK